MPIEVEQPLDAEAETIRFYSECVEDYLDGAPWSMPPQSEFELSDLLREAGPDALLLDVGCGDGRLVDHVFCLGATRYLGVDASKPLLEIARRAHKKPGVEFREANFLSLSNSIHERADVCVSFYALSHLSRSKIDEALTELRAVMKDGGTGILEFVYGDEEVFATNETLPFLPKGYGVRITHWTTDSLTPHLTKCGFEVLSAWQFHSWYIAFKVRAI